MRERVRIGVFACECGDEVTGVVNIDDLLKRTSRLDNVVLAEKLPYGCTPEGETIIQKRIVDRSLNRMVLLGCSPRIMEKRFEELCTGTGLNPSLLEIVNIRDQCARIHQADTDGANAKAWDLTRLGISRAQHLIPVEVMSTEVRPKAAVIGGGVAGMTAALSLVKHGIEVTLVEKGDNLGGKWSNDGEVARKLAQRIKKSRNIKVLTGTVPTAIEGTYGDYRISVEMENKSRKIGCSAIILAVGARELKPEGDYGYGKNPKVLTQNQLAEKMPLDDIDNVVMIQCVGSRNEERPYCGRICCISAVESAISLKEEKDDIAVTILHSGIPTEPGPHRRTLDRAQKLGVKFVRFSLKSPPRVTSSAVAGKTKEGKSFRLPYDLVSLSTPLIPNDSSREVARIFRIPTDFYGFFPESLPRLKPHQYAKSLIHAAGSAHWPCTVSEAMDQAYNRSARVASILKEGEIVSAHPRATVDTHVCRGCATCLEWCPFQVPVMVKESNGETVSFIDPFSCKGCGVCVVHCPTGAATIDNLRDETYYTMIDGLLREHEDSRLKAIAFLCEWSGYAACDLAGVRRRNVPSEIVPIRIPCAGRVSTGLILHALSLGADGVLVYACEQGECHFLKGNSSCSAMANDTRNLMNLLGISEARFQVIQIDPADDTGFCKTAETFVAQLRSLEPSPLRPVPLKAKKLESAA